MRDTAGHGPRRLLVVDDDPAICALLADLASSFGYLVDTASVPSEIDTHLGRGHDLVMLDLSLGETDGMRLARLLGVEPDSQMRTQRIIGLNSGSEGGTRMASPPEVGLGEVDDLGAAPVDRRSVELKVAGTDDFSLRCSYHNTQRLWNRVSGTEEADLELLEG